MAEKEYVERDLILDTIAKDHGKRNDYEEKAALDIWDSIKKIPAADVVEVVRCKDCRWYYRGFCNCDQWWNDDRAVGIDDNDYCSYGCAKMDGKGEGE